MAFLYTLQQMIDRFSLLSGRILSLVSLLMMLTLSTVVVLRYGFNLGFIALQELVSYLHASVFMLATAYTLQQDGHVRVDIFYRHFSPRAKAWVNSLGGLVFLLPLCGYFVLSSWEFVLQAWAIKEGSADPGGLPAVFLLKTLIPMMAISLALQAVAEILRNALLLVTTTAEPEASA
ncbi:TRAP transporter small permease subunit [Dasania sp. GY-MA-18]|uniref:TRAP transporter small permease protein n=1 Tax=Dasania phycosphaerae TaxID=2950436 RepID=A0A9J6RJ34_9GAMM|nr:MULTISPECIES: TRAP transporter small permease subunit [Dasania]MCR8922039.1 TRAP transporter small permease subunit [Dasania sp. GY-MA-18]MCZ0864467.1 TRAP transporter small permease subunit [Dasania phycosphaerae]MCZ0868195.1 TRAP transporter small permease subunit [Dasania phycosphaerae]